MSDYKVAELLIIAFFGPLIVLGISRYIEKRRFKKDRQLQTFKALFKYRINSIEDLDRDFVGALNLVYADFIDCPKVIEARKEFQRLVTRGVSNNSPIIFDEEFQIQKSVLLAEMAKVLDIKISEIDIMHGQYWPQCWNDISKTKSQKESDEQYLRHLMILKTKKELDNLGEYVPPRTEFV